MRHSTSWHQRFYMYVLSGAELRGQAIACRGDPGWFWGQDAMHVGAPTGEDWSPLTPEQVQAAQAAAR